MALTIVLTLLAGVFGLVGVWTGHHLSKGAQHEQFVRDSKKEEYRSLLDVLGTSVRQVKELKNYVFAPSGPVFGTEALLHESRQRSAEMTSINQQVTSALLTASQALDDRLFINEALTKHNVRRDWIKIEEMAHRPGAGQQSAQQTVFSTTEFATAWLELAKKLREIAAKDL